MSAIDLNCRLLCAAAASYLIQPGDPSGQRNPTANVTDEGQLDQYAAVGFDQDPFLVSDGIDAALVGTTESFCVVAFRGTLAPAKNFDSILDWTQDFLAEPTTNVNLPGKIHDGFLSAVLTLADPVDEAIQALNPNGLPIYFTGHSKGGGMAPIGAMYAAHAFDTRIENVVCFAGPRPGNIDFAVAFDEKFPNALRFENYGDIVPTLPPTPAFAALAAEIPILGKLFEKAVAWDYNAVGRLHYIEKDGSVRPEHFYPLEGEAVIIDRLLKRDGASFAQAHECACCHGYMNGVCGSTVCSCGD